MHSRLEVEHDPRELSLWWCEVRDHSCHRSVRTVPLQSVPQSQRSAFVAGLGVRREDFRLLQGRELIQTYGALIREAPPAYCTCLCSRCGSPVPDPFTDSTWFEVPAGLLDDDLQLRPDKYIFVEVKSPVVCHYGRFTPAR